MEKKLANIEDEYNRLLKILDFRLPHKFKKIGYIGAVLIFIFLLGSKFIGDLSMSLVVKDVLRTLILLFIPLIAVVFDTLITKVSGDGVINFHEVSSFEVLFILMGFQLLFFETLKRFGRA